MQATSLPMESMGPVKPGDVVLIKSMNIKATVISVSPDRILSLKGGYNECVSEGGRGASP